MKKPDPIWDWLDHAMESVWMPLYKWPTGLRHIYLCLYPLSTALRVLAGTVLLIAMIVYYMSASAFNYFSAVWRGERPEPYI